GARPAVAVRAAALHGRGVRRDEPVLLFREPRRSGGRRRRARRPAGRVPGGGGGRGVRRSPVAGDVREVAARAGARAPSRSSAPARALPPTAPPAARGDGAPA